MAAEVGRFDTATYVEPNCKPNYLSVMSYLFQAHGLFDDLSTAPQVDYSSSDDYGTSMRLPDRRIPGLAAAVPDFVVCASPAEHDGGHEILQRLAFPEFSRGSPMGRVDAASVLEPIDWNANGLANEIVCPRT